MTAQHFSVKNISKTPKVSLLRRLIGILFFRGARNLPVPYPIFRQSFIAPWGGTKEALFRDIFEKIRIRYESKVEGASGSVLQLLSSDLLCELAKGNQSVIDLLEQTTFQVASNEVHLWGQRFLYGYPVEYASSGLELLTSIVNGIGRDALPYTMYLIGGRGNTPYRLREYFNSVFSGIESHISGSSASIERVLADEGVYTVVRESISEKSPDVLFVSGEPTLVARFVTRLIHDQVRFGIAIVVGSGIDEYLTLKKKESRFAPLLRTVRLLIQA